MIHYQKSTNGSCFNYYWNIGVGVTYAEPAIGALKAFGSSINPKDAPYLYEILNNRSETLVVMVGAGVGPSSIIGTIQVCQRLVFKTYSFMPH